MNRSGARSPQPRRMVALVGALGILLAACTGSTTSPGPTSAPPTSSPAPSLAVLPSSVPSPTVESPTPSPSEAPSAEPSDVPENSPSLAPTPVPSPGPYGTSDKSTGLKATIVQVGDWTATVTPNYNFVLTWTTPTSAETVVRVEGITRCYAPQNVAGRDCVTPTTKLAARTIVLVAHARANALSLKWTWPAWEDIGEAIATDRAHDFYGVIVTFTTGGTVKVVVLATSQTCPGCTY